MRQKTKETYWVMDCEPLLSKNGEALLLVYNDVELGGIWSWKSGVNFDSEEVTFPLPIMIEFERRRGYEGPPIELLDVGVPLMSARLYQILLKSGVTNLEVFPVSLVEKNTGEIYSYIAYNIIGLVSKANLGPSILTSHKLFRLDEDINALMVSDQIKQTIEESGINSLIFFPLENWVSV